MRAMDWPATGLGPASTWPQSLRSALSMLLPSKAQIILFAAGFHIHVAKPIDPAPESTP